MRASALIVLLLIPNTSWRDWRDHAGPQLRAVLQTGSVAVMTARTAEIGAITPAAGARTLLAGARMTASPSTAGLDYPAERDNLALALRESGYRTDPQGPSARRVLTQELPAGPIRGRFVLAECPNGPGAADPLVGRWRRAVAQIGGMLIVASPNPSRAEYRACDRLTPIAIWQPGERAGVLTSASTRRPGLIVDTDVAPTIASFAGARLPGPVYGSPAHTVAAVDPGAIVGAIDRAARRQERQQRAVPWIALAIALVVAATTWRRVVHPGSVCLAASLLPPAAATMMLALPSVWPSLAVGSALAVAIAYGVIGRGRASAAGPIAIGAVAMGAIAADALVWHCSATSVSLLGYSPSEGARYYGLGDEAMGVLSGAAVLVAGSLAAGRRIWGAAALWLAVAALLGLPILGAKAGGMLVALIGLAAEVAVFRRRGRVPIRVLVGWPAAAALIGIAALVAIGRLSGSHVSQTVDQAQHFGPEVILSVVVRKLGMDIHLMAHSVWMLVLITAAAGILVFARRASAPYADNSGFARAVQVGGVVVAACLTLNDAGVVAAALCSLFVWSYAASASPAQRERRVEEADGVESAQSQPAG